MKRLLVFLREERKIDDEILTRFEQDKVHTFGCLCLVRLGRDVLEVCFASARALISV